MKRNDFQGSQIKQFDLAPLAFFAFAVGGAIFVATSKLLLWPVWLVISIPVILLILYALSAWFLPRLELRKDQIGDNAYYLGFLYTLISLTATLVQYSSNSEDDFIVSNFGVALASTVVGIFLRSLISQMRKDIVGVEREMHVSLREASMKLRSQLASSSEIFGAFQHQMSQITEESANSISEAHKLLANSLNVVVQQQSESLNKQVAISNDSISKKTDHICSELERTTNSLIESVKAEQVALANTASAAKRSISKFENIHIDTSALQNVEVAIKNFSQSILERMDAAEKVSLDEINQFRSSSNMIHESALSVENNTKNRIELAEKQVESMSALYERIVKLEKNLLDRSTDIALVESQTNAIELLITRMSSLEDMVKARESSLSNEIIGSELVEKTMNEELDLSNENETVDKSIAG